MKEQIIKIESLMPNGYNYEVHSWKKEGVMQTRFKISKLKSDGTETILVLKYSDHTENAYSEVLIYFETLK